MTDNKGVIYAKKIIKSKNFPKYVKLQAKDFLKIANGKHKKYIIDDKKVNQVERLLKLLIMPKGLKVGQRMYDCLTGYQWLLIVAVICVVHKDDINKRRYETAILEIARKNFKTYTVAILLIILMITEPKFAEFYSVAPDGSIAKEVQKAIRQIITSSPKVYKYAGKTRFKIIRDYIEFKPKETKFTPLNYTTSTFDGKLPTVFLADEVGALPNNSAIESMRSGQVNIINKLGFVISTKYPTFDNPFEDEVNYAKKILDKIVKDDTVFALLFEPDNQKDWATDDLVLKQANPAALELPEIWTDLKKRRAKAMIVESTRENFLTKHCNIIYQGQGTESYIDVGEVKKCRVNKIDWIGRTVYLGVDLSMTNDNTSVAMVAEDNGTILADVIAFIPEGRIEEKNKFEHINYNEFINHGKCIACGNKTIDYGVVEDFVFGIEERYGVRVQAIGFDRYNALSSAQKWDKCYNTIEIRQHSSVLHSPTKLLYEKITNQKFEYTDNKLLEINFQNARCSFDTNLNRYVNKKKSNGKVDMVVSLINAVCLLEKDVLLSDGAFIQIF